MAEDIEFTGGLPFPGEQLAVKSNAGTNSEESTGGGGSR